MLKHIKTLISELEKRVANLENQLFNKSDSDRGNEASYKEVLDEWLNGKQN